MRALEKAQKQLNKLMEDPEARARVQRIAHEHGMTMQEARIHYLRQL